MFINLSRQAIIFLIFLLITIVRCDYICNHVYPKYNEVIYTRIEHTHHVEKRSPRTPLKIHLWYDESVDKLDKNKSDIIKNKIVPEAVNFWQKSLFVRQKTKLLRLNRQCDYVFVIKNDNIYCVDKCSNVTKCGEVTVPEEHLDQCKTCDRFGENCGVPQGPIPGPGILNYDLVFYVSAVQTEKCKPLTIAYAAHCQQEVLQDRPVAGFVNICPENIGTKPQEIETLISTLKHEIIHVLGFSLSLFAFYRDSEGNPYTPKLFAGQPELNRLLQAYQWSDRVIRTITRNNWLTRFGPSYRTFQMIVTPNVLREARNHFNCPVLEGAELENQGEMGTRLTHWEKRVFENEALTGAYTQNPVFSRITLALMEDTGWYWANYSQAEILTWGRNLGCDFVTKSCSEWINSRSAKGLSIKPFCNTLKSIPLRTECNEDRTAIGVCNLNRYAEELPDVYQNFDSLKGVEDDKLGFYGGSVSVADYCPFIQEFIWNFKGKTKRGTHCTYEENNPSSDKNFALETYSKTSRCFDHGNLFWKDSKCNQSRQWQYIGAGCYRYVCKSGKLQILLGKYNYTCFHAEQKISVQLLYNGWLHTGLVICPSCSEMCSGEFLARGEICSGDVKVPNDIVYHKDVLRCGTCQARSDLIVFILVLLSSSFRKL